MQYTMRQVPLERNINIAVNGPFLVEVVNQERAIYGNVDITLYRDLNAKFCDWAVGQARAGCYC